MNAHDKDVTIKSYNFLANSRGWLWGLGIVFVIMGILGLSMLVGLTLVSMTFFAVILIFAGFSHVIDIFSYNEWKKILWHAFIAILYIYGGCLVLYDPFLASSIITALLAGMFIMLGITRIITAIALKSFSERWWLFFAGIIATALGIMILTHWPVSGVWFIGLYIAVEMIAIGCSYILISLSMPKSSKRLRS